MRKRISYRTSKESLLANSFIHNGCLIWNGYKNSDGYGFTSIKQKRIATHRLIWQFTNGEIPKGMVICHKCDNRACLNIDHLFIGTQADNVKDMDIKGRRVSLAGELNKAAKLNINQVLEIRELCKVGVYAKHIAPKYKISMATVYHIKNRRIWGEL